MKRANWNRQSRRLLLVLATLIAIIFILHVSWQLIARAVGPENRVVTDIAARLSVDSELSVPTWLSAFLALLGALLAYIIGKVAASRASRTAWFTLAMLMVAVSLDEVAALHELLLQGLHILAQFGEAQTLLANAWLLVLPFVIGVGFIMGRFLRRQLPQSTFRQLFFAIGIYFTGAVAVEYLSIPADKSSLTYLLGLAVIEEALEFTGLWLFIRMCLLHIEAHQPRLKHKMEAILSP